MLFPHVVDGKLKHREEDLPKVMEKTCVSRFISRTSLVRALRQLGRVVLVAKPSTTAMNWPAGKPRPGTDWHVKLP